MLTIFCTTQAKRRVSFPKYSWQAKSVPFSGRSVGAGKKEGGFVVLDVYPAVPSAQAMRPQTPNPTKTILLTLARIPYARALALPLLKELAYQENSARKHGFVQHSPPLQPESIVAGPEQARELRSKMLCSQLFKSNPKRPKENEKTLEN